MSIKELFDQIIEDGVITREEHDEFMDSIYADKNVDEEESAQISRMFALIKEGKLKIVDEDRDAADKRRKEALKKKIAAKKTE